jgi:two-component system sensor histidine kinase KdpD
MTPAGRFQRYGYAVAVAAVIAATLIGLTLGQRASLADEAMLYALAILVTAHAGRGPGVLAAGLSVVAFDFSFVEPRFTLAVADTRFLITFAVMLVVGIAIGGLGSRLHAAEAASRDRERLATEKLQLAAAARDAEVRANSEELRNALLSAVSHDLRTPLASITGMATALQEQSSPEDLRDGLETIVHEAARLSRVLENLLAVTRIEGDLGNAARREWIPIEELVGPVLARLDEALAGREVRVAIVGDLLGHIDPILGELLLANLLENAAKYTPAGTPIEITARREGATLVLEVADRGPGIPAGTETKVFDRFFRGAAPGTQGVGLGLTVCRGITSAHGGTIEALHRDGGGSRFRVRIPDAEPVPAVDLG